MTRRSGLAAVIAACTDWYALCFDVRTSNRRSKMSNPSPIQARAPSGGSEQGAAIRQSASFSAHLKNLEQKIPLRARYENFIGGKWVAPVKGGYFDNVSPTTGQVICQVPRSQAEDIERALDAAHAAADGWARTPVAARARALNLIADRIEQYLPFLAAVETYDNGKPIRETNLADLPLAVDHFRYFASCVRAQEGSLGELDDDTVAYHFHEPLGVVAQIIPWNFPILMAAWKLAPALAAGNAVVLKPAEQTPLSILVLADLVRDLLPPGVLNIVNGFGLEAGKPLASKAFARAIPTK
jgi:aldehyde dehydrogenase